MTTLQLKYIGLLIINMVLIVGGNPGRNKNNIERTYISETKGVTGRRTLSVF